MLFRSPPRCLVGKLYAHVIVRISPENLAIAIQQPVAHDESLAVRGNHAALVKAGNFFNGVQVVLRQPVVADSLEPQAPAFAVASEIN